MKIRKDMFTSKRYIIRTCDDDFKQVESYFNVIQEIISSNNEVNTAIQEFTTLFNVTKPLCESDKKQYMENIKQLYLLYVNVKLKETNSILSDIAKTTGNQELVKLQKESSEQIKSLNKQLITTKLTASSQIERISSLTKAKEAAEAALIQNNKLLQEAKSAIETEKKQCEESKKELISTVGTSSQNVTQLKDELTQLMEKSKKLEEANIKLGEKKPTPAQTILGKPLYDDIPQPLYKQESKPLSEPPTPPSSPPSSLPSSKQKQASPSFVVDKKQIESKKNVDSDLLHLAEFKLTELIIKTPTLEETEFALQNSLNMGASIQSRRMTGGSAILTKEQVDNILQALYRLNNTMNSIFTMPTFLRLLSLPIKPLKEIFKGNEIVINNIVLLIFYDADIFYKMPYEALLGNQFNDFKSRLDADTVIRNRYVESTGKYGKLDTILEILIIAVRLINVSFTSSRLLSQEHTGVLNVAFGLCAMMNRQTANISNLLDTIISKEGEIKNAHNKSSKVITYLKIRCDKEPNKRYNLQYDKETNSLYVGYNRTEENLTQDNYDTSKQHTSTDHYLFGPFTKVFTPKLSNVQIAGNCVELQSKLESGESVFVFGYGASGAGKTSSLVYFNKGVGSERQGILIHLITQMRRVLSVTLTVDECVYNDKDSSGKAIRRVNNQKFTRSGDSFKMNEIVPELVKFQKLYPEINDEDFKPTKGQTDLGDYIRYLLDADRAIRATTNNPNSSRSHVLIYLKLEGLPNSPYLVIGDFAGVENQFLCNNLDVLQSMDSQSRDGINPFYTKAVLDAEPELSKCPIHGSQKIGGGECNRIESLTTSEKRYINPIGSEQELLGIVDIKQFLQNKNNTYNQIKKFVKFYPVIRDTIDKVFAFADEKFDKTKTPLFTYLVKEGDTIKLSNTIKPKPVLVNISEADIQKLELKPIKTEIVTPININDYSYSYATLAREIVDIYNALYVTAKDIIPITEKDTKLIGNIKLESTFISSITGKNMTDGNDSHPNTKRFWGKKDIVTQLFKSKEMADMLEILQDEDNVRKMLPTMYSVIDKLECRKLRETKIRTSCTCRTAEGVFINKSLSDLRADVASIIKARMTSEGVIKIVPPFNDKCVSLQCNPYTNTCFDDDIQETSNAGLIMRTLKDKIGEQQYDLINIGVFCVFNWSREVEGKEIKQSGGIRKYDTISKTPPKAPPKAPAVVSSRASVTPATTTTTAPSQILSKYIINQAHPMPYIDLYDLRAELKRLKEIEFNSNNNIKPFVIENYQLATGLIKSFDDIQAEFAKETKSLESINKYIEDLSDNENKIYGNILYSLYLNKNNDYWNVSNEEYINIDIYNDLINNVTKFENKIDKQTVDRVKTINTTADRLNTIKTVITQLNNINAISPLGTLEFTDQVAKYSITAQSCGFSGSSRLKFRSDVKTATQKDIETTFKILLSNPFNN